MRPRLVRLTFPYALILLSAVVVDRVPSLAPWWASVPRMAPYAVWGTGALLAWRFSRGRVVFAMLVLAIAHWSMLQAGGAGVASAPGGRLIFQAVTLLLPLNLLALAVARERGFLTPGGMMRLILISCQPLGIAVILRSNWKVAATWLEHPLIPWAELQRLPLAQPTLLVSLLALVVLTTIALGRATAMESGFLWALVAALVGSCRSQPIASSGLYLTTAGLILLVATVEASYAMAFRDELTGLPARRALNETLQQLGAHYTVAMVDIDFFKKFNDRYGHDVGDQVLRKVAGILARVDGGGRAYRYGGEEFTIVFPGKDIDETLDPLEDLRMAVADSGFVVRGRKRPRKQPEPAKRRSGPRHKVTITISIGVAERTDQASTPQQVIKAADRALYRAKRTGRNRVAI